MPSGESIEAGKSGNKVPEQENSEASHRQSEQ